MPNYQISYKSNNLNQISSKNIKTVSSNIESNFVPLICYPWKKGILGCISAKAISCNIPCITTVV